MANYLSLMEQLEALVESLRVGNQTYEQIKEAAVSVLDLIDPRRPYGTGLFDALCRLTVTVTPELVILRTGATGKEVLLRLRAPEEAYALQWHSPGSAIRPGELIEDVKQRIERRECGGVTLPGPVFCGYDNNQVEERGHFLHLVYVCNATGFDIPTDGVTTGWFSIDALPTPTVEHHVKVFIPLACGLRVPNRGLNTVQHY